MCVHRDTGAQRAVKVLRKSHMDEDEKKMLFNEINILRNLVSALIQSSRSLRESLLPSAGTSFFLIIVIKYWLGVSFTAN